MKMDGNKVIQLCTFSLSLATRVEKSVFLMIKYRFASVGGNFQLSYPANTALSPCSSSLGTFHQEERLHFSDRNSILI